MLDDVLLFDEPYRHFLCFESFGADDAADMREVLSSDLDWGVREGSFYVTYRLDLRAFFEKRRTPRFLDEDFLFRMRDRMSKLFSVPLSDTIQVLGHRMIPGQRIGVHNDNPGLGFENYRIVTQFTFDQKPEDGGELNIHTSDRPQDVYQSIRPYPNMSFGFETSARSYHSVNLVRNVNRDAMLFNFWHAGNAPAVEKAIQTAIEGLLPIQTSNDEIAASDSGIEAALLADGLVARWGLDSHVGAAAALLALESAPPRNDSRALRAALAASWRAALDLNSGAAGSTEIDSMARVSTRWMRADLPTVKAVLSLAVWAARAPRRMFTAEAWELVRMQVAPQRDLLPIDARVLADEILALGARVCAEA